MLMSGSARAWLRVLLVLLPGLTLGPRASAAEEPIPAAVFDFAFRGAGPLGGIEGADPDERRRLARISDQLRRELAASGRYLVVDLKPAEDRIRAAGRLDACNGCAARLARSLGAEVAVTGTVYKVSNLILDIRLQLWNAGSGGLLRAGSVSIRGNTDESWSRGVSYLVRHRLLKERRPSGGG